MSRRDRFEKKYRKLKNQTTPDLWNRIEAGLEPKICIKDAPAQEHRSPAFWYYKPVAALASLAVIWISIHMFSVPQRSAVSETKAAGGVDSVSEMIAGETAAISGRKTETRFVSYQSLLLAPSAPQTVPVPISQEGKLAALDAGTIYFSEDILADTQLFCQATVLSVSYETDEDGAALALNYELVIDKILYAQDYTKEQDKIIVKSPIIENETETDAPLYALMENRSYVLPVKKQNGDYWLVFPSAPQIEVTLNNEYVFHNGFKSLLNDSAYVVLNSPAGVQDYYYDRMFLRKDADVLTELSEIVEEKHQEQEQ